MESDGVVTMVIVLDQPSPKSFEVMVNAMDMTDKSM